MRFHNNDINANLYFLLTQKGGKKSMRKKLVSGLLAATMVASLMVGCGSEGTDTTEATEATEAPAAEEAKAE